MTLVRERRQKQALRLILPPPPGLSARALSPSSLSSSSSSSSSSSGSSADSPTLSDLEKLSVLGRGNGGTVYKVSHKPTSIVYAFKVVRTLDKEDVGSASREAEILQRIDSSQYVVRCVGIFYGGSSEVDFGVGLCFAMEYMDAGSLHDILSRKKRLPEQAISGIVRSVLKGLQHLHGLHVVHRDIKPSNLLVNMRGEVKIADFGASRVLTDGSGGDRTTRFTPDEHVMGTCAYMSPERMDPERWDGDYWRDGYAGDVWSLGVVAMECYVGRFPLVGPEQKLDWVTLMCAVCMGENVESVVKSASPEFGSFCRRCLEREWRKRGTVEELLHHPFVNGNGVEDDVVSYIAPSD